MSERFVAAECTTSITLSASVDGKSLTKRQVKGLALCPDNFLLVNSNGTVYGRSHADKVMKKLIFAIGCDKSKYNLTLNSIRVGVTSLAHHQDIDALKIMRYVRWVLSQAAEPTMHTRQLPNRRRRICLRRFVRCDERSVNTNHFLMCRKCKSALLHVLLVISIRNDPSVGGVPCRVNCA